MLRRSLPLLTLALAGAVLAAEPPVAPANLPTFRGDGAGMMAAWAGDLVAPAQAKVLWTSEERNFGVGWGYGVGPSNKGRTVVMSCGFSGPVAVGDSVYFSYFLPSGDVVDEEVRAKSQDPRPESWKVDADDVLVCMDAETGKTRWRAVFAGRGLNWGYHRKVPWTHVCVVDGKVYWMGCAGKVYCVNATDGAAVWESDTGDGYREFEKMRAKMRAAKSVETAKRGRIDDGDSTAPGNSSPCYAEGVLVLNDSLCERGSSNVSTDGNGLVGLDAATGKPLWRIAGSVGVYVSPLPWRCGERTFIISVAPKRALCVDPKTGAVVWEIAEPMDGRIIPAVSGTHLLVQRSMIRGAVSAKDTAGAKGLTCYRIDAAGATKLWEMEPGDYSGPYTAPIINGAYGYALTKAGLICVELATGTIRGTLKNVGDGYLPLVAGNGILLAGTSVVSLDPDNFRVLGSLKVSHETFSPPFLAEGRLYVRGRLPGYDGKNGAGKTPPEPGCIYCVDLRRGR